MRSDSPHVVTAGQIDEATTGPPGPATVPADEFRRRRRDHWDGIAGQMARGRRSGRSYHARLAEIYRWLVPPGSSVLELGCGPGRLLDAVQPARGVGVDFSGPMLQIAGQTNPDLELVECDAHDLDLGETFQSIVLSDLVHDVWDLQEILERARAHCTIDTRLILNFYSRLWQPPLRAAEALGLANPILQQNWFTPDDIQSVLRLAGFETVRGWQEVLCPVALPLIAPFMNKVAVRFIPFRWLALTNFVVARVPAESATAPQRVTVVVPMRNEAGNVEEIMNCVPELGAGTELILIEGGSTDGTYETAERVIAEHPERNVRLLRQPGRGKGDAVRHAFDNATGDILAILDADLTTPAENLPRFVKALSDGTGEFINGVRLVYPMHSDAMRFFNLLANKAFGLAFSWVLGQPVKDTLCGTKVVWKRHWEQIHANREVFGGHDPYGDFDLLFGAALLNLKIVDLPIRYRERVYGDTNINRWSGGLLLFRMLIRGARRLKFI